MSGPKKLIGSITSVDDASGAAVGWAINTGDINDKVTIRWKVDGAEMGTIQADEGVSTLVGICADCTNGFSFTIPSRYRGTQYSVTIEGRSGSIPTFTRLATRHINASQGNCVVSGGGGVLLQHQTMITRAACQAACDGFPTSGNRTCLWGEGSGFEPIWLKPPKETGHCYVRGGAGVELWPDTLLSGWTARADCQDFCADFQDNACRSCQWAGEWLMAPDAQDTCLVQGSGGLVLHQGNTQLCPDCRLACDSFEDINPCRTCKWGGEWIKSADATAACTILSASGTTIHSAAATTCLECRTVCDSFSTTNPNRTCDWGSESLPVQ